MTPALQATAKHQSGAFSLLQAVRSGATERTVRRWVAGGLCRSPHSGVYVLNGAPETHEQRAWVAVLAVGSPVALAGLTAAWRLGLIPDPPWRPQVAVPHCRVPEVRGIDVRRVQWARVATVGMDGLPTLCARDAIITAAEKRSWESLLLMVQRAVYAEQTTPMAVLAECRRGLPGSKQLRVALSAYLRGHDSPPEREVFARLSAGGRRPNHCNVALETPDGRRTTAVDGYYERGVAYDYRGRAAHAGSRAAERDGLKHASVTAVGVALVVLDSRDLRDDARLRGRLRTALGSVSTQPPVAVVHLPGRACVCGHGHL